jgi:FAD/FMN-containing dehydrogenase
VKDIERRLDPRAVSSFQSMFRGDVVLPGTEDYDAARVVWNGMIDRYPAVVARPVNAQDVASAVGFAREQDIVIAVRGGGHSVGGFSTCDGGMVIELSLMRGATVDAERREAWTNGGAHLGELDRAAQAFDLACPVGVVGHTGVAGLTLGGGMGRLQRRFGFTIDNLLSVDLVTADGRLLHVSDEENSDLFWGIRGAGPNFGVVTSFRFRVHPLGPAVTQGWVAHPIERAHEVAAMYGELGTSVPDELWLSLGFGIAGPADPWPDLVGQPVIRLGVCHSGSEDAAERDVRAVRGNSPLADTIERRSYLAVQTQSDEEMAWGKRFYMKGGYGNDLTPELVDACVEGIRAAPSGGCTIGFWAQGGAIGRVPADAMAFTGRDADFWIGVEAFWEDPADDDRHMDWGRAVWDALTPHTTAGHYVNDVVETGERVVRAIYGDAKYERLVGLKRIYDPDNVFRLNQNVKP